MKNRIKPDTWYTLSDMVRADAFPFCSKDIRRYRRVVKLDKQNGDYLKTVVSGNGKGQRYTIKGENIINFLSAFESGKIPL